MSGPTVSVEYRILDQITQQNARIVADLENGFKKLETGMGQVNQRAAAMESGMVSLRSVYGIIAGVVGGELVKSFIHLNSEMENNTVQFKVMLGSADAAKTRMAELAQFAAVTPFTLPEVVAGSRQLQVFGGTLLATGQNLKMVGDIAAGVGQNYQNVAYWVGRMYDALQSGRPIMEIARGLETMGALSGTAAVELENLQKHGMKADDLWKVFTKDMGGFNGMMEELNHTFTGQWSNMIDNVQAGVRAIGSGGAFGALTQTLTEFNDWFATNKVTIFDWAGNVGRFMVAFVQTAEGAVVGILSILAEVVNIVLIKPVATGIEMVLNMVQGLMEVTNFALKALPPSLVPKGWTGSLDSTIKSIGEMRQGVTDFKTGTDDFINNGFATALDLLTSKVDKVNDAFKNDKGKDTARGAGGPSESDLKKMKEAQKQIADAQKMVNEEMVKSIEDTNQREIAAIELKYSEELAKVKGNGQATHLVEQAFNLESENQMRKHKADLSKIRLDAATKDARTNDMYTGIEIANAQKAAAAEKAVNEQKTQAVLMFSNGVASSLSAAAAEYKSFGEASKSIGTVSALIDTYVAANKAFASAPYPYNYVAMAGAIAAGLANVTKIQGQKFEAGGPVNGPSHRGGGVPAELEGGEYVLSRKHVDKLGGQEGVERMLAGGETAGNSFVVHYSPIINAGGRDATALRDLLEQDKGALADFLENEILRKGYYSRKGS